MVLLMRVWNKSFQRMMLKDAPRGQAFHQRVTNSSLVTGVIREAIYLGLKSTLDIPKALSSI